LEVRKEKDTALPWKNKPREPDPWTVPVVPRDMSGIFPFERGGCVDGSVVVFGRVWVVLMAIKFALLFSLTRNFLLVARRMVSPYSWVLIWMVIL